VLPVANAAAVEMAVKFGLAVGGRVNARSVFARKNYFYPDLPKGYQISQYEMPIVSGGELRITTKAGEKVIRLTRAHLEEDAGKSIHGESLSGVVGRGTVGSMIVGRPLAKEDRILSELSGIDLNRAGTPLLEIVSEPDLRGPEEAVAYARALHALVRWIGICDGNMQEGSFRCDANVSVRKSGETKLGTRCELKNLNSFLFMEQAIKFEARRQIALLEDGEKIIQETRLFDADVGETRSMRTKEEAHDYRYFPDPDLLPLVVTEEMLDRANRSMPELPVARRRRYADSYSMLPQDIDVLVSDRELSDFFELVLSELRRLPEVPYLNQSPDQANAKSVANWVINELRALLNRDNVPAKQSRVTPLQLAQLLRRIFDSTISGKLGREVLEEMWVAGGAADEIIARRGLRQISDAGALEKIVADVLAQNAKQVEDYRAGKAKAFNSLVGQVMQATQGKANPAQVNALLKAKLAR
jgi:aspartyl-tRNA(Asn)/glutamyl-tRNA(Gln) amidotransferase subunit B